MAGFYLKGFDMAMKSTTDLWADESKKDTAGVKPKLRVALIGCGGISGVHIEGWKRLNPECQIVACADPIEDRRNHRGDIGRKTRLVEKRLIGRQ